MALAEIGWVLTSLVLPMTCSMYYRKAVNSKLGGTRKNRWFPGFLQTWTLERRGCMSKQAVLSLYLSLLSWIKQAAGSFQMVRAQLTLFCHTNGWMFQGVRDFPFYVESWVFVLHWFLAALFYTALASWLTNVSASDAICCSIAPCECTIILRRSWGWTLTWYEWLALYSHPKMFRPCLCPVPLLLYPYDSPLLLKTYFQPFPHLCIDS